MSADPDLMSVIIDDPTKSIQTNLNELCLLASELAHIGITVAEKDGAASQILEETLVHLVGRDGNSLIHFGLEICCKSVECEDVVRLQMLLAGDGEPGLDGVDDEHRCQWQTYDG